MSGSLSPTTGQFWTAGIVAKRNFISCGGAAQGDHTALVSAGPLASAGMSMNRKPAASAIGAGKASGRIVLDKEPTIHYLV